MATSRFDSEGSSLEFKTYASVASDINLLTDTGQPCRYFRVQGSGDVVIEKVNGDPETIPGVLSGETVLAGGNKLLAATTATNITVFW